MQLTESQIQLLDDFLERSRFLQEGALITDLDGTAVHEVEGKTIVHHSVEIGLKKIHDRKHPVIINSLRFPLSIIRTFGKEWYKMTNAAIPVILLNGSQLGYITKVGQDFAFEQIAAFTLSEEEIITTTQGIMQMLDDKINDIVLFYYPEDWTKGEIIWTPVKDRIPELQNRYKSASSVISVPVGELQKLLLDRPLCMLLLLLDIPGDKRMAYQHTRRDNFITHKQVDKLYGTIKMAAHLGFQLQDSIGAGDSAMDVFLNGVGLAVQVGNNHLPFRGTTHTLKLPGFLELGDLLGKCAEREPVMKHV